MRLVGDFIPQHTTPELTKYEKGIVLANLEGPVCADGLPKSGKVGVCLHSAPFDVPGEWAFALANNHLMDYGEKGLDETLAFLKTKGYPSAGAGSCEVEARKPMWLEESGKKIAVISCCERQFGLATEHRAGVAAKGLWLIPAIKAAKNEGADFVIISCHAGSEFSPFVNPRLREFYHMLIDAGADVIHGHHAHVPQGWEEYKGRPIFYGLGNYVVDKRDWSSNPHYKWSIVADIDFSGAEPRWTAEFSGELPSGHRDYIESINAGFQDRNLLEALWQDASVRLYPKLYEQNLRAASVVGHPLSMRDRARKILFALGGFKRAIIGQETPTTRSKFYGKVLYNFVNCESHYDMISTALGVLLGVEEDLRNEKSNGYAERVFVS